MIYDYQCPTCKGTYTKYERMSAHKNNERPTCVCGGKMNQIIYPTTLKFSGSGFYETDSTGKKEVWK